MCSKCLGDEKSGFKFCAGCCLSLPIAEFTPKQSKCRKCINARNAKHYKSESGRAAHRRAYHKHFPVKKCKSCLVEYPRDKFDGKLACPDCLALASQGLRKCRQCGSVISASCRRCPSCENDKIRKDRIASRISSRNRKRTTGKMDPDRRKIVCARYYRKNKNKFRARNAVHRAVKRGLLPDPRTLLCSCGKQADQYHHESYDKEHWLDVTAKCTYCHGNIHRLPPDTFRKRTPSGSPAT